MPNLWKNLSLTLGKGLAASLARMPAAEVETIAKHAFASVRGPAAEALFLFCGTVHDLEDSAPNNVVDAGEEHLLALVQPFGFKTYFDVGANFGDWANAAAAHSDHARIDCFEVVPATFERLTKSVKAGTAAVHLNDFGLSDHEGEIEMVLGDTALVSSQYSFRGIESKGVVRCRVRRGDDYAREQSIERVDMLKIDVEGAEGAVLKGFEGLLGRKGVRLIQFEYNRGAIESKFLLQDFYRFFGPLGYTLGKLTPRGVKWRPEYEYAYEDFNGPNYVACLSSEGALMQAIGEG